jgi:hypothetical protein
LGHEGSSSVLVWSMVAFIAIAAIAFEIHVLKSNKDDED